MNAWFEKDWSHLARVFKIRRWVKKGEEERAGAKRILDLNQKHWHRENRLHYRRDVTLGEDACQVRLKNAPQSLAALNGGILALMDWLGVSNVTKHMRHSRTHP